MNYAIGVDIGGTKTALGMIDEQGKTMIHTTMPTDLTIPPQEMISKVIAEIKQIIEQSDIDESNIKGIGVGAPGPLDSKVGMITCPPNLPSWRDIPIKKWLEAAFSFPVTIENDANAAALAEKWIGAGKGYENYIYMTVSTGIGAGIITEGRLLRGRKGNAGDIGHIVVNPAYGECTCGQKGCLEWIASGTAIAREGSKIKGETLSTEEVFHLYEQKDPEIVPYIEDVFNSLSQACVSLINIFDTEKIILGGGVTQVGNVLFDPIRSYVKKSALNPDGRKVEVVASELGSHNGIIGAAALWLDEE